MADRIGTKAAWLSGLIGVALLAAVVAVALQVSDAEAFARLVDRAQPTWLAAALALRAATYLAQGEIWRCVTRAAGSPVPTGLAYRLSIVKLLVDQALPSSGLSGAVVVAGALQRRGIGEDVTTAGIVVNASAYVIAYIAALSAGLAVLTVEGRMSAPVLVAGGIFVLAAAGVAATAIRLSGTQAPWLTGRAHVPAWLRRCAGNARTREDDARAQSAPAGVGRCAATRDRSARRSHAVLPSAARRPYKLHPVTKPEWHGLRVCHRTYCTSRATAILNWCSSDHRAHQRIFATLPSFRT